MRSFLQERTAAVNAPDPSARKKGNEANHEIVIMNKEDAEELLSFSEMLLRLIFEFPAVIKRKVASAKNG